MNTGSTTLAFSAYSMMRHMGKNPQPADARRRGHAVWADHCLCGRPKHAWDRAGCWKPGTFKQVLGPDALFLGAAASNSFTFDAEFIA